MNFFKNFRKTMIAATFSLLAAPAIADTPQTYALQNLRIIDGNGDVVIEDGTIILRGKYLTDVGATAQVKVPDDAIKIDYKGQTALPGLISDHSHVGLINGLNNGTVNYTKENLLHQLKQYENFGITTVTSLGVNRAVFYDVQKLAHQENFDGADLFGADLGIGVPNNAPPVDDSHIYRPENEAQARAAVQEMAARKPALIKIWVDDFHGTMSTKMKPEIYQAVIDEAHKIGLRVAAHVYYLADAKKLIADGVDVLAHGIRDKDVDEEFIAALKKSKAWYIATLQLDDAAFIYAQNPKWCQSSIFKQTLSSDVLSQLQSEKWQQKILHDPNSELSKKALAVNERNLKALYLAGVNVGFGTDSGATPLRIQGFAEHRELKLMTESGLTPLQSLTVATKNAASLLKLSDRGTIEKGKIADMLIVNGAPDKNIDDTLHIKEVWHFGNRHINPEAPFNGDFFAKEIE